MSDTLKSLLDDAANDAKQYDVTEAAVRGARRRRGALVLGPIAAVVAVALVALGIWLPGRHTDHSAPPARPQQVGARAGVDVALGWSVYTTSGARLAVPADINVIHATRDGGWIVLDLDGDLWHLDRTGARHKLASHQEQLVTDPSGTRIAFGAKRSLTVARLSGDRLTDAHTTRVPSGLVVPTLIRTDGAVVLVRSMSTTGSRYDLWRPDHGDYRPTAGHPLYSVDGLTADGRTLVGRTGSAGSQCLTRIDPDHGFTTGGCTRTGALLGVIVSPTGVVLAADTTGYVTYRPVGDGYRKGGRWTLATHGWIRPGYAGWDAATWANDHTAVMFAQVKGGPMRLLRLDTGRPGAVTGITLPGNGIPALADPVTG